MSLSFGIMIEAQEGLTWDRWRRLVPVHGTARAASIAPVTDDEKLGATLSFARERPTTWVMSARCRPSSVESHGSP